MAHQAEREGGALTGGGPGGPLTGRVAVLTGAAGGLGSTTVLALRRAGATVVPVDVHGDDCLIADVSTAEGNRAAVEAALERHGRLDILILNAGAQAMNPIASYPEADWDRLMNLMVKGPFLAMKFAWPQLTRQPGGRIIATASTVSLAGAPCKAAGFKFGDCLVVAVVQRTGGRVARRFTETYAAGVGLVEDSQVQLVDLKGL